MDSEALTGRELLKLVWADRYRFLAITAFSILLAAGALRFMVPEYRAVTVLAPESGAWQGSALSTMGLTGPQIGMLSALTGIPPLSPYLHQIQAVATLRSEVLAARFIEQNHLLPSIYHEDWNSSQKRWKSGSVSSRPTIRQAVRYFSTEIRRVKLDSQTGLVTLSITWRDPKVAAKWAANFVNFANAYYRRRAMREARTNVSYLKAQLHGTADLQRRQVIYALLEAELEVETAAEVNRQYAFKVVDAPLVPDNPVFPRPFDLLALAGLAGASVSAWLTLIRRRWRNHARAAASAGYRKLLPRHMDPALLGLASAVGGAFLTLYPPHSYSALIGEPDMMFGNWRLLGFLALCVAGFLFGSVLAAEMSGVARPFVGFGAEEAAKRRRMAVTLAIAAALIGVIVAAIFIRDARDFFTSLAHGGAQAIRAAALARLLKTGFAATNVLPVGFPMLLWAAGNIGSGPASAARENGRNVIYWALFLYALCAVATLSRSLLMPYLLSVMAVLSGTRWSPHGIRVRALLLAVGGALGGIFGLFLLIAYFRSGASQSPFMMLAGYLPASYNRLAAVLSGWLTPPVEGVPYYSLRFFWYPPVLRRIMSFAQVARDFGLAIPLAAGTSWLGEFGNVASAGLNPIFIWPTTFGYTFYDFGWWSPFYFVIVGFLSRKLWGHFVARTAYGLVLYSYVVASILLWSTDNMLALPQVWVMFAVAVGMRAWERRLSSTGSGASALQGAAAQGR